jgi:hypothetical protein
MRVLAYLVILTACGGAPRGSMAPPPGPGAVAGLVRAADTGAGVEGARVVLRRPGSLAPVQGVSDASGAYYIASLPPGRYVVAAYVEETPIGEQPIDVAHDRITALDFAIGARDAAVIELNVPSSAPLWRYKPLGADPRSGVIEGTVADLRKERLPSTVVSVSRRGETDAEILVTDDRGRFQVAGLSPGMYTVTASYAVVTRAQIQVQRLVEVMGGEVVVVPMWLETDALDR